MSLTNGKCPNCNAALKFEAGKNTVVCEYCRSTFFVNQFTGHTQTETKAAPPPPAAPPPVQNTDPWGINNNNYVNKNVPPRPVINTLFAVVLAFFYVFPAIIYVASVHNKQKEWDRKYARK